MPKTIFKSNFLLIAVLINSISCSGQYADDNKQDGIIYFSEDKGLTWNNMSKGLPQNIKIPLGGISTNENQVFISTKEYGVFSFNKGDKMWSQLPIDSNIIHANIGSLILFKGKLFIGTQDIGVSISLKDGSDWQSSNQGLTNLTIRRFLVFDEELYVCTNDGFYQWQEDLKLWKPIFRKSSLQVNGATLFQGDFYLATNRGIYKRQKTDEWINILANNSLHNISSSNQQIYAMSYTSILMTSKDGNEWESMQDGLPQNLYTFNVLSQNTFSYAGQWDGVFIRTPSDTTWRKSNKGLPDNFAVTNLQSIGNVLIAGTSQ